MHIPIRLAPQAPVVIKQIVNVIKEENFSLERVILDQTGESTLDFRLKSGAMVGLSVCHDKMPPEIAAEIVLKNPDKRDRLVVNSELGYGNDGYFSVPRVILAMRMLGLKREEIEKVTFENRKKSSICQLSEWGNLYSRNCLPEVFFAVACFLNNLQERMPFPHRALNYPTPLRFFGTVERKTTKGGETLSLIMRTSTLA